MEQARGLCARNRARHKRKKRRGGAKAGAGCARRRRKAGQKAGGPRGRRGAKGRTAGAAHRRLGPGPRQPAAHTGGRRERSTRRRAARQIKRLGRNCGRRAPAHRRPRRRALCGPGRMGGNAPAAHDGAALARHRVDGHTAGQYDGRNKAAHRFGARRPGPQGLCQSRRACPALWTKRPRQAPCGTARKTECSCCARRPKICRRALQAAAPGQQKARFPAGSWARRGRQTNIFRPITPTRSGGWIGWIQPMKGMKVGKWLIQLLLIYLLNFLCRYYQKN